MPPSFAKVPGWQPLKLPGNIAANEHTANPANTHVYMALRIQQPRKLDSTDTCNGGFKHALTISDKHIAMLAMHVSPPSEIYFTSPP